MYLSFVKLPNTLTMWSTAIACFLPLCGFLDGVASAALNSTQALSSTKSMSSMKSLKMKIGPAYLDPLRMIRRAGYPAEAHIVLTHDGYLLTMHRIPGGKLSPTVLLQHGLLSSSADWIITGKDKALAYILADKGYDVWMGNFRGNTYSRAHRSLSPAESQFWDFSFHELGMYDVPAMIEYIVKLSSQPLDMYVGHSMGTTAFYVMASELPEVSRKVQMMGSFAPVAFMNHIKSPVRYLAPFLKNYEMIARFLGKDELLPHNKIMKLLAKYGCDRYSFQEKICANIIFLFCGFDAKQFDYNLLPTILDHVPAGSSTKTVVHYGQLIESGRFCQYDYGVEKNQVIYNATKPPNYDLGAIKMPMILFYADNDWLSSGLDVKRLHKSLSNKVTMYHIPYSKFNHLDYLWAKDAPKLVYNKLLEYMKTNENII